MSRCRIRKKIEYISAVLLILLSLYGCSFAPAENGEKDKKSTDALQAVTEDDDKEPVIVIDNGKPAMVIDEKSDAEEVTDGESTDDADEADDGSFHGYELSEDEKNDPRVKCIETANEGEVILEFAGDINFDDGYANMGAFHKYGGTMSGVLSGDLIDEMNSADIFMINNEFPYSQRGTPTAGKRFTFRAKPERVELMKEIGADIVSLANNHAYDWGAEALLDTFDVLDGAQIPFVGAGRNIDEACKPFYFIAGGMKIGYVSATQIERNDPPDTKEATADSPGVLRTLDPTRFIEVINDCDSNADFTVAYVHWGSENTYDPDQSQRDLAEKFVDAGADLIIGDHSHCLQGFEYVKGVPVIYSMGNFWFSSKNLDSGLVKAAVNKQGISELKFIPCVQHDCRTDMYKKGDSEYSRILGVMAGLSREVSIDEDGVVSAGAGTGIEAVAPKPLKKASYQLTDEEKAAIALQELMGVSDATGASDVSIPNDNQ